MIFTARMMTFFTIVLFAGTLPSICTASQDVVVFWSEDFEDGTSDGWKVKPGYERSTLIEIDSTLTYDSRYCLVVTSTFSSAENTEDWTEVSFDFEENGLPPISITDSTVFYWEWRIADVYVTKAVRIALSFEGFKPYSLFWASHSLYTIQNVYWDRQEIWCSHREHIVKNVMKQGGERILNRYGLTYDQLKIKEITLLIDSTDLEKVWLDNIYIGPLHRLPKREIKQTSSLKEYNPVPLSRQQYSTAAALGDVDGDGDFDLYVVNRRQSNRLYLNDGKGTFDHEITARANVSDDGIGTGAVFADMDNDGDQDLLLTNEFGVNRILQNDGRGIFQEITHESGLDTLIGDWYGVALGDVDQNGLLDGFISNSTGFNIFLLNKKKNLLDISKSVDENLIIHGPGRGMTYGSTFGDVDNDGDADMFITNTSLFENQGGIIFKDVSHRLNWPPEYAKRCNEGGIFGDIDNDGDLDLYIAIDPWSTEPKHNRPQRNLLFLNDGSGTFNDFTLQAGVGDPGHSEAALFADLNNDGYLDIYVANREDENSYYRNNGDGTFTNVIIGSGFEDCGHIDGVTCCDIDDDGDIDLILIDYFRGIVIKENHADNENFLKVRLIGTRSNRNGVGSKVSIYDSGHLGDVNHLRGFRECQVTQGFGPSSSPEIHFGLGDIEKVDVEVIFPSGLKEVREEIDRSQTIYIVESPTPLHRTVIAPLFILGRQSVHRTLMHIQSSLLYLFIPLFGLFAGFALQPLKRSKPYLALPLILLTLLTLYIFWGFGKGNGLPFLGLAFLSFCIGVWNPPISFLRRKDVESNREHLLSALREFEHSGAATRNLDRIGLFTKNLVRDGDMVPEIEGKLQEATTDYFRFTSSALTRIAKLSTRSGFQANLSKHLVKTHRKLNDELNDVLQRRANVFQIKGIEETLDIIQSQIKAIQNELDRFFSTDIYEAIQYILNAHSKELSEVGLSVSPNSPKDISWPKVRVSHTELEFILENLVSNALQAMEKVSRKELHIKVNAGTRRVNLEVQDTGLGIPRERWNEVFRPGGGHFGLPHSRMILDKYGGRIYFKESSPDYSTAIVVELKFAGKK